MKTEHISKCSFSSMMQSSLYLPLQQRFPTDVPRQYREWRMGGLTRANKLSINYSKTNFMSLKCQKHNPTSFEVITNNHSISPEDNLKYLGVLLDNKLSWKPQVQKVKTQLSWACGVLSKLKHYTTQSVSKVVYNSLIHPYLNYSILNVGRASNATIQPVQ